LAPPSTRAASSVSSISGSPAELGTPQAVRPASIADATATAAAMPPARLRTEDLAQVAVAEHAIRIEAVAHREEVLEPRIGVRERGRRAVVHLAPVRPAIMRDED